MKKGFNLLLYASVITDEVLNQLLPTLQRIKDLGYDGVEVPLLQPQDRAVYQRIGGELEQLDLGRTAVAIATEADDPSHPDKAVRDAAVQRLMWEIEAAHLIGADVLCGPMAGALGWKPNRGLTEQECDDRRKWSADTLRRATEFTPAAELVLAVEALNRFETVFFNTLAQLVELVERVGHPGLRMMVDTFHQHIEGSNPRRELRDVINWVAHVHISENTRGIPGTGQVDFRPYFLELHRAGYKGWVTIEAFGQRLPELAAATCIWRPLFPDEDTVLVESAKLLDSFI